jgi:hypothetical protein
MAKTYKTRTLTHGAEWAAWAPITKDSTGALITTVAPQVLTGFRGQTIDETADSTDYYADDQIHVTLSATKTWSGDLTFYQLEQDFITGPLGYKLTAGGTATNGLIETGKPENFIFQYCELVTDEFGVETEKLTIFYNVKGSALTAESATDEDSPSEQELSLAVTASPNSLVLDADGVTVPKMVVTRTEANSQWFDLAYTQILTPLTPAPTSSGE